MATLIIPTPLRKYTDGEANFVTSETTIESAVKALTTTHPKITNQILDQNGKLRHFIKVFVGDEDIRFLNGEQTEIKEDTVVSLIPAIAGGVE